MFFGMGPETAMEISALVDTPDHDWHGVENPNGYPLNGGDGSFVDTRPNMGHKICLQSFSSQKWLQDAGVTLKKIIERLENGPYSKQIIGYQIAFGRLGENNLWGTTRPAKRPTGVITASATEKRLSSGLYKSTVVRVSFVVIGN